MASYMPADPYQDDVARQLVRILCTYQYQYQGSMSVDALQAAVGDRKVYFFGRSRPESFLMKYPNLFQLDVKPHRTQVTAISSVRPCDSYATRNGCPDDLCPDLHICKFYAVDKCRFMGPAGGMVKKCNYSHNFMDDHNAGVLREHLLDGLGLAPQMMQLLLKQSWKDVTVPEICKFYNVESGCEKGTKCTRLHVCRHYITGDCKFHRGCKRSHNIYDPQPLAVLQKFNIDVKRSPKDVLKDLRDAACQKGPAGVAAANPRSPKTPTDDKSFRFDGILEIPDADICTFYVRGKCNFNNSCNRHHCDTPYLWQRLGYHDSKWVSFEGPLNVKIEKNFCDPSRDDVTVFDYEDIQWEVDFHSMKATNRNTGDTGYEVRRLSTWSSGRAPPGHLFATEWIWYWEDERGQWTQYGDKTRPPAATVDSTYLEKAYLEWQDNVGAETVKFTAGKQKYILSFDEMLQENRDYETERDVRRRPKFLSEDQIETLKRTPKSKWLAMAGVAMTGAAGGARHAVDDIFPAEWDRSADDYGDYQLAELKKRGSTASTYKDVVEAFRETMERGKVVRIVRVQNRELWENFKRKGEWMKKKNQGKPVDERQLFHGTRSEFVDAICQQNFDWRVSGTSSGTAYGKGSYFARDASYSRNYTQPDKDGVRQMFFARVLVGTYANGKSSLVKPPPRDPSKPYGDTYDACVNDANDPGIFVIFDNSQAYPEFIISYK